MPPTILLEILDRTVFGDITMSLVVWWMLLAVVLWTVVVLLLWSVGIKLGVIVAKLVEISQTLNFTDEYSWTV